MTPDDLAALEHSARAAAPRCDMCAAAATVRCLGCRAILCAEHAGGTPDAPLCTEGTEPLPADLALTLAAALREAWATRDAADARANRLALDINTRDAILDRAVQKLGWPTALSCASHWRDRMCAAIDETAGKISKLENLVSHARESYPRAEVLRVLDAAAVLPGSVVDRVQRLVERCAELTRERDAAIAAVDAVRADYAPRREPPTAEEVRAVSRLWGRPVVAMLLRTLHGPAVEYASLLLRVADDGVIEAGDHSHAALVDAESWLFIGPTGPVAWSELAALIARGGDRG